MFISCLSFMCYLAILTSLPYKGMTLTNPNSGQYRTVMKTSVLCREGFLDTCKNAHDCNEGRK